MIGPILLALAAIAPQDAEAAPLFEVSLSPASELWLEVRARAAAGEPEPGDPLAEAVRAARACDALLASAGTWSTYDSLGVSAEPGAWLAQAGELKLPRFVLAEGATRRELRTQLELLLAALDSAAPAWLEEQWPARRERLVAAQATLAETLDSQAQRAVLARLERWLAVGPPAAPVRVRLVTRCAPLGGVTVLVQGTPLCLAATGEREPLALAEAVVHEIVHALEARPVYPPSVMTALVTQLMRARVKDHEPWSHPLYFLAAAEAVRSALDPEHVDNGVSEGYYAGNEAVHAVMAPLWRKYVAQEISRADLVTSLVAAAGGEQD